MIHPRRVFPPESSSEFIRSGLCELNSSGFEVEKEKQNSSFYVPQTHSFIDNINRKYGSRKRQFRRKVAKKLYMGSFDSNVLSSYFASGDERKRRCRSFRLTTSPSQHPTNQFSSDMQPPSSCFRSSDILEKLLEQLLQLYFLTSE